MHLPGGDPPHAEFPQPRLLGGRHRRCRRSKSVARASLHFTEHNEPSASADKVDLALSTAPISIDDHEATLLVPPRRQFFAVGPEGPTTRRQTRRAITGVAVLRAATLRC